MENPQHESRNDRTACAPPYAQETPLGMYLPATEEIAHGLSERRLCGNGRICALCQPFTNGAYIHGVPVNVPRTAMIEYSWSLGTTAAFAHVCEMPLHMLSLYLTGRHGAFFSSCYRMITFF